MNHPFEKNEDRERMNKVLASITEARNEIDTAREWLAPQLDANSGEADSEGCTCVYSEAFDLDALLFSAHRMLHLIGSGMVTHLNTMDQHEFAKKANAMVINVGEAVPQATDVAGPSDVEVGPLPVDAEDKGPGPHGVH